MAEELGRRVIGALIVVVLVFAMTAALARGQRPEDRRWIYVAFLAHLLSAFVQEFIVRSVYRGGDSLHYHMTGLELASWVEYSLGDRIEVVFQLIHGQLERPIPVQLLADRGPTGSMTGMTALIHLFVGESLLTANLVLSMLASLGSLLLFRALRDGSDPVLSRHAWVVLIVPSAVFWSSGLLKESVAMAGLGAFVYALSILTTAKGWRRLPPILLAVVSGYLMSRVKPYVLVALMIAAAYGWAGSRFKGRLRMRHVAIATLGGLVAMLAIGALFPSYSVAAITADVANLQEVGMRVSGGSNYSFSVEAGSGLAGQLATAPLALLTALYRPLPFEVTNAPLLVAAIEALALIAATGLSIGRRGLMGFVTFLVRTPNRLFLLAFVAVFSIAVGLATTNMGTLSRYRAPMMPLWALLMVAAVRGREIAERGPGSPPLVVREVGRP